MDSRRQRIARHLFQKSSDALFLFDPGKHAVLDANAAARRLTGFDASALRAMTLETLFVTSSPDDLAGLFEAWADRGESGTSSPPQAPRRGYRLRRRQEEPIAVSVGVGAIGSPSDASRRPMGLAIVRGAEASSTEAEVLGRIFAFGPELFGVGTYEGLLLDVNSAWEEALGYTAGELVGTSVWDLIHPIARDPAAPGLGRGRKPGLEVRMRHKDGGDRWIRWSVVFAGERVFAVGRDTTARRRLEGDFRQAKEAAAAAHRAKNEFLAGMSHEIRTPMTAILGFADLLAERWRRSDDDDGDGVGVGVTAEDLDALQTIKRNGDLLLGLINDILDLAKIEADRAQVALDPCSPAQLVADVMGLMYVRAEAQGLSLDVEFLTPIPATIATDAVRLRQILVNLIGNAIKFTDRGGVRLRVRLIHGDGNGHDNGESEPGLQFEVVDTGIGIREEEIARLFQPFYRVDASQSRRHGGAGLGLALSLRLAERLGGTIGARSRAEGGSEFTLTIPAGPAGNTNTVTVPADLISLNGTAEQVPASMPTSVPVPVLVPVQTTHSTSATLPYRVLLAEDNRDTQRVMLLRLAASGIDVTPAANGQLAVDLALAAEETGRPFDVILMDMQMPVLDGYEATRTLRGAGYRRPIIAVTAHAMTEDRDECLRFGCDDYLAKPIDWPRLTALIATFAQHTDAAPCP